MQTGSPNFFSRDYATARSRFIEFADAAKARLFAFPVEGKGPAGELLTIDVASFGPSEPEHLVAISSGLHGAEGFAGSAIQLQFIALQLKTILANPVTGAVLVHAINPYGMAHWERVNGNNVDLNRNFCDHPDGHIPNPTYDELEPYINPMELTDSFNERTRDVFRQFSAKHGIRGLQSAIASGQYDYPKGLYFGGTRVEESNHHLRQIARIFTESARRVAWIDIHTGLGDSGEVSLITDLPPHEALYNRIKNWYGDLAESTSEDDGTSTVTNGSLDFALLAQFPKGCEGTHVTAEFGTCEPERSFWALRARNWLRHYGQPGTEKSHAIIREALEVFNPSDLVWRTKLLNNGAAVIDMTMKGLSGGK